MMYSDIILCFTLNFLTSQQSNKRSTEVVLCCTLKFYVSNGPTMPYGIKFSSYMVHMETERWRRNIITEFFSLQTMIEKLNRRSSHEIQA